MSWRQVGRWRARRQLLSEPAPDTPTVARRLCGVHAQVASGSTLIAGVRTAGPPPDLHALLWAERTLVRTWAMRGTLHLLPAGELDLWTGALTDRESRRRFPPSWEREHGVTAAELHAVTAAVGAALGAEPLSRAELAAVICAHPRRPELAGPLSTVTFVSPAAWLGRAPVPVDPGTAAREVLLRFLAANGPATAADVARWWGEPPAPAKRWVQADADAPTDVEIDGEPGCVVRSEDAAELAAVPDRAGDPLLLPGFDPWVIAPISHRRRAIPAGRDPEVSRTAGWIPPCSSSTARWPGCGSTRSVTTWCG